MSAADDPTAQDPPPDSPPPVTRDNEAVQIAELIEWSKQNHGDIEQLRLALRAQGDLVSSQLGHMRTAQGHLADALLVVPGEVRAMRSLIEENEAASRRRDAQQRESIEALKHMADRIPEMDSKLDDINLSLRVLSRRSVADAEHETDQQLRLRAHSLKIDEAEAKASLARRQAGQAVEEVAVVKRTMTTRQLGIGGTAAAAAGAVLYEFFKRWLGF